jgi:thiamine-monophosphate kinase
LSSESHGTPTVADAGELALIARVRARAGAPPAFVPIGIGDDAAVVEPARGEQDVITTDSLVEHIHFRRDWTVARSIGAKAVAVNLSDLAAMGATPRVVLLSLILPPALPLDDFDALVDGVVTEAAGAGAALIGGNISRSPGPLVVDVTAMGSVGRRRVLTRAGGRPGDELYVTGSVGAGAAGLAILTAGVARAGLAAEEAACVARYEHPAARVRCGRVVAASRAASACMDLSDGLADAARQIAQASGTGVELEAEAIPVSPGAARWLERPGVDPVEAAIAGGDDYELLFAVSPRRRRAFLSTLRLCRPLEVTRVGRLTKDPGLSITRAGVPSALSFGFHHF